LICFWDAFGLFHFFGFLIFCPFLLDDFFVLRFPLEMRSHKHATQNSSKSHARLYTGLSRVDMNSTQLSFNDCTSANSAALQGVRRQASRHTQSIHFEVAPLVIIFVPFPARIHRGIEHSNMRQEVMMKMPIQHNNTTQNKTCCMAALPTSSQFHMRTVGDRFKSAQQNPSEMECVCF